MAEIKTQKTTVSVSDFLNAIPDQQKKADSILLSKLLSQVTKSKPAMWGTCIVGFGNHSYTLANGKTNPWFLIGFSPRKENIAIYGMAKVDQYSELLEKLGKYKTAKSCFYIKKLEDVDLPTLKALVKKLLA